MQSKMAVDRDSVSLAYPGSGGLGLASLLFTACLLWLALGCSGSTAAPASSSLRLCSFNTLHLGYDNHKDFEGLARILESHCDASVLLEVMRKGGSAPGYDALLESLGEGWQGQRTAEARPENAKSYAEYYGFVWKRDKLSPCAGFEELEYLPDGSSAGGDFFDREPAYGCFESTDSAHKLDFLLVAYHANFDSSRAVIEDEVRHLDSALEPLVRACPAEKDIFVFGDFNLNPADLDAVTQLELVAQSEQGSTLNSAGERSQNLYDNLLLYSFGATTELVTAAEILDVRDEVGGAAHYRETVSDHLPLRITLDLTAPDDDDACPARP
jgi:hypothetical protein